MPVKRPFKPRKKQTRTGDVGAPKGSANAMKSGHRSQFTLECLDGRTRLAKTWRAVEGELVQAIGGEPSPQESILIARAAFKMIRCHLFEIAFLTGEANPDDSQYLALANSLRLDLQALGLGRRAKPVQDLTAYIKERYGS